MTNSSVARFAASQRGTKKRSDRKPNSKLPVRVLQTRSEPAESETLPVGSLATFAAALLLGNPV
jgi:hypothetical protein